MLIDNKNLFPLTFIYPTLNGYYMDGEGNVWSTKRGKLAQLYGSTPYRGYGRYNSSASKIYTLNGRAYNAGSLVKLVSQHADFAKETHDPLKKTPGGYGPKVLSAKALGVDLDKVKAAILPQDATSLARVHAPTLEAGIDAKGLMIAAYDPVEGLLFTKRPAIHLTPESAKAEMERLAREVPGTKFVMVRILNTIVSGGVTWQ